MEKCVRYNKAPYTTYVRSMLPGSGHSRWNHSTHPAHGECVCVQYMIGVRVRVCVFPLGNAEQSPRGTEEEMTAFINDIPLY